MSSISPAPNPPLTRPKRLLWMMALVGGVSIAFKFLDVSWRQQRVFEDILGDKTKLSISTQSAFHWQHWLGDHFIYLSAACLIVLIWIGFSKSARQVQTIVLLLTGILVLQAIISVAIPYPDMLRQLQQFRVLYQTVKP